MGANASSCSPPSNLLLWLIVALKLVVLTMPHGLLFSLSNLRSSSWSFVPIEFLVVLFFMVILSWFKHEVFNRCSSWYYIPFKALIVMFFMIICSCNLAQGHWCSLWSPLEILITMLFMDFHSYSQAWGHCTNTSRSFRSFPWSSIMLLYSLDIFVVVFCVPTFLILGIQGVHCHNFSFGFITKNWGITKEVGQNNVLWSKDISTRVRKWKNMSPNIPNQIPIWELTIPSYPKTLEYIGLGDQTLSKLCFFYTFKKFLKCKYLNWCCIQFEDLKDKLWQFEKFNNQIGNLTHNWLI